MPDPKQIPHLIRLLDDDSPKVRSTVVRELMSYGSTLRAELEKIVPKTQPDYIELLDKNLQNFQRSWLKESWPVWFDLDSDCDRLETALSLLADFQNRFTTNVRLKVLLDHLTEEYRRMFDSSDPVKLAKFLFQIKQLSGATKDYYNPQNCNLVHVAKTKRGIPISLSCIYILIGKRLGLDIQGCNLPGHFMARISHNGRRLLVDCFNGGELVEEKMVFAKSRVSPQIIKNILRTKTTAEMIIHRVLNNLINSYQLHQNNETSDLIRELQDELKKRAKFQLDALITSQPQNEEPNVEARFKVGDIVSHKNYGYRGIIIDLDYQCQASNKWYYYNLTQPKRTQPWYHVLVHNSEQITYAAESNLEFDESSPIIDHPLVSYFFTFNEDGKYIRNTKRWPN